MYIKYGSPWIASRSTKSQGNQPNEQRTAWEETVTKNINVVQWISNTHEHSNQQTLYFRKQQNHGG
jgi:hypothetical protein